MFRYCVQISHTVWQNSVLFYDSVSLSSSIEKLGKFLEKIILYMKEEPTNIEQLTITNKHTQSDERKITMTDPHLSSETYRVCVMYEACPCFVFPTHVVEPE